MVLSNVEIDLKLDNLVEHYNVNGAMLSCTQNWLIYLPTMVMLPMLSVCTHISCFAPFCCIYVYLQISRKFN